MKLPCCTTAALALVLAGCGGAGSDPKPARTMADTGCEAAIAFAEQQIEALGEIAFSTRGSGIGAPPGSELTRVKALDWFSPKSGKAAPPPSADVLATFPAVSAQSPIARCPALRAMLDKRKLGYGDAAVAAANAAHRRVLDMSMPAATADEAVFAADLTDGGLGSGDAYHMRRGGDGKWRVVAVSPLWIS